MEKLTEIELDVAREILNIGLSKSADSLSFFTKNKVIIKSFDLTLGEWSSIETLFKDAYHGKVFLLTTELMGELKGECFLVFNENEVEQLLQVSLPPSILQNPDAKAEMSEAILLELDNIVAASVITQLSNILKYSVYGNVPQLDVMESIEIPSFFQQKEGFENLFCFKADFITENVSLQPTFIWGLDDKFIQGVKAVAKEGTEMLNRYKS